MWGLHNLTMWYSWQLQIQIQILETWCAMKGNMFSKEVGLNEKPSDSSIWGWGWSPAWWGCNPTWRREHVQVGKNSRDDCSCTGCLVAEIPPPEEILEFSTGFCSTKRCRSWSRVCGPKVGSLWAKAGVVGCLRCPSKKGKYKNKTGYPLPAAILEERIYQKCKQKNPIKYLNEKRSKLNGDTFFNQNMSYHKEIVKVDLRENFLSLTDMRDQKPGMSL